MSGSGQWYGRYVDEDTKAKEESSEGARKGSIWAAAPGARPDMARALLARRRRKQCKPSP